MRGTSGLSITELKKRGRRLPKIKMTRQQYIENAGIKIVIAIFLSLLLLSSVTAESTANSEDQEGVSGFFENALNGFKLITGMVMHDVNIFVDNTEKIKQRDTDEQFELVEPNKPTPDEPDKPSEGEGEKPEPTIEGEEETQVTADKPSQKRRKTECEKNEGRCRISCKDDEIEVTTYSCELRRSPSREEPEG
ncbi:hypothetical protein KY313_02855, partial [Candidatus Woesearchaeota archaeon]|nr:hypothetical protein [Candidatus Woesearchaeota archaeon]